MRARWTIQRTTQPEISQIMCKLPVILERLSSLSICLPLSREYFFISTDNQSRRFLRKRNTLSVPVGESLALRDEAKLYKFACVNLLLFWQMTRMIWSIRYLVSEEHKFQLNAVHKVQQHEGRGKRPREEVQVVFGGCRQHLPITRKRRGCCWDWGVKRMVEKR